MNRPLLVLLTLITAIAFTAWWVLSADAPQSQNQELRKSALLEQGEAPNLSAQDIATLENGASLDSLADDLTRSNIDGPATGSLADPNYGEVRIQVVDARHERPVAGATVWVLNQKLSDSSAIFETMALAKGVRPLLDQISERGSTNQSGIVVLPYFGGELKVAAHHGDSFVFTTIELDDRDPIVVKLRPALNVPVKVLDADGKPVAQVPVSLRLSFNGEWRIDVLHTYTNENGLAILENVGIFKEESDLQEALYVGLPLPLTKAVEVQIPIPESEQERLDHAWAEDLEPLVLTMPPMGPVEVRLFDVDGQPFLKEAPVFLYLHENLGDDPEDFERRRQQAVPAVVTSKDGTAFFPWSQLGERVIAESSFGGDLERSSAQAAGPASAKNVAKVDLFQHVGNTMIRGRLLLATDKTLPAQRLDAQIRIDSPKGVATHDVPILVADDGSFNFSAPTLKAGADMTARLVFEVTSEQRLLMASCALPLPLGQGSIDCGDLLLKQPPLLVSGRVVRPDGGDAIGVDISVEMQLQRGSERRWRIDSSLYTVTQQGGYFRIRGPILDARYRLKIYIHDRLPVSEEFAPGTEDMEIQLIAGGRIHGRVVLDHFLKPENMQVVARFADTLAHTEEDNHSSDTIRLREPSFHFQRLPLSPVSLEFKMYKSGEVIATVSGLSPVLTGDDYDPQLNPFDLRGLVYARRVSVSSGNGAAVDNFSLHWKAGDVETSSKGRAGVATLVTTQDRVDVQVISDDHRTYDLHDLSGDIDIVLQPPLEVQVAVQPLAPIPAGYRLGVLFKPQGGSFYWQRARLEMLNDDHRATIRLGEAGTYQVSAFLQPIGRDFAPRAWLEVDGKWFEHRTQITDAVGQEVRFELDGRLMNDSVERYENPK